MKINENYKAQVFIEFSQPTCALVEQEKELDENRIVKRIVKRVVKKLKSTRIEPTVYCLTVIGSKLPTREYAKDKHGYQITIHVGTGLFLINNSLTLTVINRCTNLEFISLIFSFHFVR